MQIRGKKILVVGKLGCMSRREAREQILQAGAVMTERADDDVDIVVIGADELLLDESEAGLNEWLMEAAEEGRIEIFSEAQFCQQIGLIDADDLGQLYTPAMLATLLKLPLSTIRRWHRRGLIRPAYQIKNLPYYDFQEVATARRVAKLVASGATPQLMEKRLARLAKLYPQLQRPLSQLSVIAEGSELLLRHGEGLIELGGQRRLNFDQQELEERPSSIRLIDHQPNALDEERTQARGTSRENCFSGLATPSEYLEVAGELEDRLELEAAMQCYRAMMLAFGPLADVQFRLAELLYQQGDLTAARERYYAAIELDENFVEARASLGCVLMELKQYEDAYSAFQGALRHHPGYLDVHFHFARLLDELDRPLEAEHHWRFFLEAAPQSPWADEARQRLGKKE